MRTLIPTRAAAIGLCAAALLSCSKQGASSRLYDEARAEFNAVYARLLEEAYASPEMGPIEQKLEQVPADSEDAPRAQELLRRIRSGRERLLARRAEREAELAQVGQPIPDFEFSDAGEEGPADAGADAADGGGAAQPVAGMPLAELRARFGMCFEPGERLDVVGRGNLPSWTLRDMEVCRQRHPGFDERLVIVEGDKVLFIGEKKDVERVPVDAGARAPAGDGGP